MLADLVRVEKVSADSHFFQDLGADSMVMAHFCARVRKHPDLPSISMKDIYRHPTIRSLAAAVAAVAPAGDGSGTPVKSGGLERALAEVLAEVLKVERVQPDAHFFKDLGADSMVMAHFCARVRKRADLPSISMKQVYANSTIRGLAAAVAEPVSASPVVTASASRRRRPYRWSCPSRSPRGGPSCAGFAIPDGLLVLRLSSVALSVGATRG